MYSSPPYPPFPHCVSKPHHCISAILWASAKPPPHSHYYHLTFDIWDFEFAVFPFPKVFRLLRDESPSSWYLHQEHRHSSSQRTVTSTTPLYITLAIALLTPSPFCVTCLSRLAIWVLPATWLMHISGLHHPLHTYHIILVSYHPLCHKIVPVYTQLLSWFAHFALWPYTKKRISF